MIEKSLKMWLTKPGPLFFAMVLICSVQSLQADPNPPCSPGLNPPYPDVKNTLNYEFVFGATGDKFWVPPECTGWKSRKFSLLLATSGYFYSGDTMDTMLDKFANISDLKKIWYWSTTRKKWRYLIPEAFAVQDPDILEPRGNFKREELKKGEKLFYFQQERSPAKNVVFGLTVKQLSDTGLTVELVNEKAITKWLLPLFDAGEYEFLYFLNKAKNKWYYYSLLRVGNKPNSWIKNHKDSYINRATAIFRHLAGLPTDLEPPAAP